MIVPPRADGKVHYADASKAGDVYQNDGGWWVITKLYEPEKDGNRRGEIRPATTDDLILERLNAMVELQERTIAQLKANKHAR